MWLLAVGLVTLFAGGVGVMAGSATLARHRAETAADFAALLAAIHVLEGGEAACARAAELAAANGGRLTQCEVRGLTVTVAVEVRPVGLGRLGGPAVGRARAGPASAPVESVTPS